MYAIRCKVFHPQPNIAQLVESHYVILVDAQDMKLYKCFNIARDAMIEKYHGRYPKHCFEFSAGAQKIDGSLNGQVVKILLSE